jgi:hypothetical protein
MQVGELIVCNFKVKGKSPAASLINRRSGASCRVSDGASSLGRKVRPKSANISPVRHARDLLVSPPTVGGRASAGKSNILVC